MTETCGVGPPAKAGPWLQGLADDLALVAGGLDVDGLTGAEAAGLTETFALLERLAGAGKTLAAGRVAETGYCREMGFDTAPGGWPAAPRPVRGRRPRPWTRPGTWPTSRWRRRGRRWWPGP